jgi:hypothetical protein
MGSQRKGRVWDEGGGIKDEEQTDDVKKRGREGRHGSWDRAGRNGKKCREETIENAEWDGDQG